MTDKRIWVLIVIGCALFGLLEARLVDLQLVRHGYFEAVADSQRRRASELIPHRGTIYVSEGGSDDQEIFPIATNKKAWIAYAVPRNMSEPKQVAEKLAPALVAFDGRQAERAEQILEATGQRRAIDEPAEGEEVEVERDELSVEDEEDLIEQQLFVRFNQKTDPYEPLLKPYEILDGELQAFLESENLEGIVVEEIEARVYPESSLAAHLVGYVGYQDEWRVGRYGVEGFFDRMLAGNLGFLASERDSQGQYIGVTKREFTPAEDGDDIVLSVDRVVQSIIEEVLKEGVERFDAERGSILVMNPKTGAVLGMATYPTYDPNNYWAITDARVQSNPVVSDQFEPGSILKPLVMAAGIEEALVEPSTTMTDTGPVKVAEYTIDTFDGKHYGVTSMTEILEQSNNVGMVWLGQQLGAEKIYSYLRRFGLGEQTGILLEGETRTHLTEPDDWNVTTVATASFGQGVVVTPLQALTGINALANDGVLMQPHVIKAIRRANGEIENISPQAVRQVVSSHTAQQLNAMMVSVIENGVAGLAQVPGYFLAGKTGTAQVADETGRYSEDQKIISFVGFGPSRDPQFSILVKLDNPAGLSFASGTAAPMFRQVAEQLLTYYQIAPDYEEATRPTFTVDGVSQ